MKLLLCLLAFLWLAQACSAQPPTEEDPALRVGETIPDFRFSNVINFRDSAINLSSFSGKLVIIELWSTWCTSCIIGFPKLDSLQREFADDVQFVLVNNISGSGDTRAKVLASFSRWGAKFPGGFAIPVVMEDTMLQRYFPHKYLSHLIWIGRDRTLIATSNASILTR